MSVQNGTLKMELLEEVGFKKCLCNKAVPSSPSRTMKYESFFEFGLWHHDALL